MKTVKPATRLGITDCGVFRGCCLARFDNAQPWEAASLPTVGEILFSVCIRLPGTTFSAYGLEVSRMAHTFPRSIGKWHEASRLARCKKEMSHIRAFWFMPSDAQCAGAGPLFIENAPAPQLQVRPDPRPVKEKQLGRKVFCFGVYGAKTHARELFSTQPARSRGDLQP